MTTFLKVAVCVCVCTCARTHTHGFVRMHREARGQHWVILLFLIFLQKNSLSLTQSLLIVYTG